MAVYVQDGMHVQINATTGRDAMKCVFSFWKAQSMKEMMA